MKKEWSKKKGVHVLISVPNVSRIKVDTHGGCQELNINHSQSFGDERYFITSIKDYSLKTWVYFLVEKSKALEVFRSFKAFVEKQNG